MKKIYKLQNNFVPVKQMADNDNFNPKIHPQVHNGELTYKLVDNSEHLLINDLMHVPLQLSQNQSLSWRTTSARKYSNNNRTLSHRLLHR